MALPELPKIKGKYLTIPMVTVLAVLALALQFGINWAYQDHKTIVQRVTNLEVGEQRLTAATQQRGDRGDGRYEEIKSRFDSLDKRAASIEANQIRLEKKLDDLMFHMMPTRTAEAVGLP